MHSAAALSLVVGLIITLPALAPPHDPHPPIPTLRAWCGLWEGGEGRALVYRYVWRDDLSDTFDESVRVLLPVERQSVCLVRATVPDPL